MMHYLFVSVGALIATQVTFALTLKDVRQAIRQRGSSWKAEENRFTQLSTNDRLRLLGANLEDEVLFSLGGKSRKSRGPAAWDWRKQSGGNFVSPVLDQGRCGSCVAFAVVGALETQLNINRKLTSTPWKFSTQHLFSCGGGGCETGWTPSSALSFLKNKGIPEENCFPYTSGAQGEDLACSMSCKDSSERAFKITSYTQPTMFFANDDSVKEALLKGPVVATMKVYDDFMFYKSGVYKHVIGEYAGGHAILLVGWSDEENSWIARNSWGEDWGEKGYFKISRNDVSGVGTTTWRMSVTDSSPYVALSGVDDYQALAGRIPVQLNHSYSQWDRLGWSVLKSGVEVLSYEANQKGDGEFQTSMLADGVYEIRPFVEVGSLRKWGLAKTIYVLNAGLSGAISFVNTSEGQELSGSHIFELALETSPVPFEKVVFVRKSVTTGEVVERGTTNVGSNMKMSWRTTGVPDGRYEISFYGISGKQRISSRVQNVNVKNQKN